MSTSRPRTREQNRKLSREFVERRRAEGFTPTSLYLKPDTREILDRVKTEQGFSNRSEAVAYVAARFAELAFDASASSAEPETQRRNSRL